MHVHVFLKRFARPALPLALTIPLLSGCALFPGSTQGVNQRLAVSLSAPKGVERSAQLQALVDRMDAAAFPGAGPIKLKLSYEMKGPGWPPAVAALQGGSRPGG